MLLEKDSSVSIHDRNIQCVATEMYKVSNGKSPLVVNNIFRQENSHSYNLRLNYQFSRPLLSLYFTGPKVYPILVQLSGTFFLIVRKTYLILVFLKSKLKNGNPKIFPADFSKHTFLETSLHRLSLW